MSVKVAVLTGAGISAESGVPTFKGQDGLWKNYRPEELATPEAFRKDPAKVWEWYLWRRSIIARAEPNEGHLGLVELENLLGDNFFLITQNVDGLHQKAGSKRVVEFHGNIWRVRCLSCGAVYEDRTLHSRELPLRCKECNGVVRPDVVWYGEPIPERALEKARLWANSCDLFVVIGTSAQVYPAADLPYMAKVCGAKVVEINTEETPVSQIADIVIREPASKGVKGLFQLI